MHFKDPIQELDVGVEGRDKELVKHLVQLFYGCKCLSQIIQSLQKFLDIKSDKKDTTIESILIKSVLDLLDRLGKERKEEIASISIWNEFTGNIQGVPDEKNPNNYYSNEYGTLYRTKISSYLSDSLGGKVKHSNRGNVWTFNKKELKKLSRKDPTKIKITIGMRKRATKSEGVNTVNTNTGEPPQNIDKNKETEQLESPTYTGFTLSQSSNAPIYIKKEGL